MKANAPKRKVFHDAVDLLTEDLQTEKAPAGNSMIQIPVDDIRPFPDHPFRLYEGDRLEEMVQSVKDHGILVPVIVRKVDDSNYEMLAGHNRQQAARLAGLQTVPAIVKEGLTAEDAEKILQESMQAGRNRGKAAGKTVRLPAEVYDKYFHQVKAVEAVRIIEAALAAWFEGREATDVQSAAD